MRDAVARNAACGISARTGTRADGRCVGILSLRTEGMTTEEKAKAWDEAIERAKSKIRNDKDHVLYEEDILDIFPSLKESDEERIRKALMQNLKERFGTKGNMGEGLDMPDVLAWLEKQGEHSNFLSKIKIGDKVTRNEDGVLVNLSQLNRVAKKKGEQKPAESNDIEGILLVHDEILNNLLERYKTSATFKTLIVNLKNWWNNTRRHLLSFNIEQNPDEWSEDDEKMYTATIFALAGFMGNKDKLDWLKSLKERVQFQNTWKPSESDIRILEQVIDGTANPINYHATLHAILEKLKKLREK